MCVCASTEMKVRHNCKVMPVITALSYGRPPYSRTDIDATHKSSRTHARTHARRNDAVSISSISRSVTGSMLRLHQSSGVCSDTP